MLVFYLCCFSFLAGFIDSIVGGGGLIQVPALLLLLPHTPLPTVLGTGKLAAWAGTSAAGISYARRVPINWRAILPAAFVAGVCSFLGARAVTLLSAANFRPVVLGMLIIVAIYTFKSKHFGTQADPAPMTRRDVIVMSIIGGLMGFYDGFFGPGTGSFLIFLFIHFVGIDFLRASANAKIVNIATNIFALGYFVLNNHVLYYIALPMALCNILGGVIGSHLAITNGSRFVRRLFLGIVIALIAKLSYDMLGA